MRRILLLLLGILPVWLNAQMHCGREQIIQDQAWQALRAQLESDLASTDHSESHLRNGPLTISVVFHQLALSSDDFLPDSYFLSQIDVLNEDFGNYTENNSGTPFELRELPIDMGIRFCLAKRNADGEEEEGIIRKETNYPCIGDIGSVLANDGRSRLYYSELGGADAWDSRFYLNIWVAPTCNAFLGFASFPEENIPQEDGAIISTEYFGRQSENSSAYPYHLGRVATHEVGHYFGLEHLWGAAGGCESDDGIQDTPPQESFHRGCPVHPTNSCGTEDYFFNFMDYSDDACLSMFTAGQRSRVLNGLFLFREELLETVACNNWGPKAQAEQWQLFPNPTADLLYIVPPPSVPRPIPYRIYDSIGRLIEVGNFERTPFAIDTSTLGAGLFYLRIKAESAQITQAFYTIP